MTAGSDTERLQRRFVSSGAAIVAALVGGLGILISVYSNTNRDLTGWRFLLSIVLAACAIVLLVEGVQRARMGKRWRPIGAAGVGIGLASLLLALVPAHGEAAAEGQGLRFELRPTAPGLFDLAFTRPIPLPAPSEGWAELSRRGGIDIGDSHFRMILANESTSPVSVLSVRAEVLGSEPIPHGAEAWAYSQGDEGIDRLVVVLPNGRRGSVGRIYAPAKRSLGPKELEAETPFFQGRYVLLKPGEVYPASLTVESETPRTIEYRLVAEGESASRHFVVRSPRFKVVGRFEDPYQQRFARYYSKGHDPHDCTATPHNPWIDARVRSRSLACPYGPGHSYETPPLDQAEYPPGQLRLRLQVQPGRQSAQISGVTVATPPAAALVPGVVPHLLEALGTWTRCTVYFPTTGYWTARWEDWGLGLTFPSDRGVTDCTPRSRAGVQQIELGGVPVTVETDLGRIDVDAAAAKVPAAIGRRSEVSYFSEYEREYLLPGASPCDHSQADSNRSQLELGEPKPGGILALREDLISSRLSGITSTFSTSEC